MRRSLIGISVWTAIVMAVGCSSENGTRTGIITLELGQLDGACPVTELAAPSLPLRHVRGLFSIEGGNDDPNKPLQIWAWQDADGTVSRVYIADQSLAFTRLGMTRWREGKRTFLAQTQVNSSWHDGTTLRSGQGFNGVDENGQVVCFWLGNPGPLPGKVRQDRYDPQWLTPANDIFIAPQDGSSEPTVTPKPEQAPGSNLVDPTDAPRDPGGDAPGIPGGGTGGECGQSCYSGGPISYSYDSATGQTHANY